ncbi:nucleoredoxin-like protein 2 [Lineus longissimus]|uniref:nucleoredoxin-like protein 2 n=1 Tax=Lineus longissimus TaxID=88925 RepID=UPI002B4FAE25
MATLFQDKTLLNSDWKEVNANDALKDKVVAILFAASWCRPSVDFIKVLAGLYGELRQRFAPLEIVFVSSDKTKQDMEEFYLGCHGNWLALDHDDPFGDFLRQQYNITAIPKLIVIKASGDVISQKGRKDIQEKGTTCFRVWAAGANVADWEKIALRERSRSAISSKSQDENNETETVATE